MSASLAAGGLPQGSGPPSLDSSEFAALFEEVAQWDEVKRSRLVAHRGFHSTQDELSRPLENTLQAYSECFRAGVQFAECDVVASRDEVVFLSHDSTFARLAHEPNSSLSDTLVEGLLASQVEKVILKGLVSPARLADVLKVAVDYGAKIVVEIKPTEHRERICKALIQIFADRKDLLEGVGVFMSFDHEIIFLLSRLFNKSFGTLENPSPPLFMCLFIDQENKTDKDASKRCDWGDPELVRGMVKGCLDGAGPEGKVDGFYFQISEKMLHDSSCQKMLRELSKVYQVGIWNASHETDGLETGKILFSLGVRFLNTDFVNIAA